jgi:hypothetical protein
VGSIMTRSFVLAVLLICIGTTFSLRFNETFDALVVSMGGAGCTSTIKRVAESHGKENRLRVNWFNNRDRLKHAYPDYVEKYRPNMVYGIVYISGNLTNAVKSLARRHFIHIQVKLLRGDLDWIERQTYTNTLPTTLPTTTKTKYQTQAQAHAQVHTQTQVPLFRSKPKWEAEEDSKYSKNIVSSNVSSNGQGSVLSPQVLRLRRILAKAGQDEKDPLGLYDHFLAWRAAAQSSRLPWPVLFIDIASTQDPSTPSSTALDRFVGATKVVPNKLLYDPHRRKGQDALATAVDGAVGAERELIQKGLRMYDKWTEEILLMDGKSFYPSTSASK